MTVWWKSIKILTSYGLHRYANSSYQGVQAASQFLLIANHAQDIDPMLISSYLKHPAHWISAQEAFLNPIVGFLLKSIGAYPIKRYESDFVLVKKILESVRAGKSIALFPSGNASWDGIYREELGGTDRLIQLLRIPVLAIRLEGSYLSFPRWARKRRKGKISLKAQLFSGVDALEYIRFSEWDLQKTAMEKYVGTDKALGIERVLWFCPDCHELWVGVDAKVRAVLPRGDEVVCPVCHHAIKVDEYGYIEGQNSGLTYRSTLPEVLETQRSLLQAFVHQNTDFSLGNVQVRLRTKDQLKYSKIFDTQLRIGSQSIFATPCEFLFSEIKKAVCFRKTVIEFLYAEQIVRIISDTSAFLLLHILEIKTKDRTP